MTIQLHKPFRKSLFHPATLGNSDQKQQVAPAHGESVTLGLHNRLQNPSAAADPNPRNNSAPNQSGRLRCGNELLEQ
jgi:hypothetical protein